MQTIAPSRIAELKRILYYITERGQEHTMALKEGFVVDYVQHSTNSEKFFPGYLHIIGGLQFGNFERYKQILNSGAPYIQCDRGYIDGIRGISGYMRLTLNAYQQNWIRPGMGGERVKVLARNGLRIEPWRTEGRHILVVPPSSPEVASLFTTGGTDIWLQAVYESLRKVTNRPIIVSVKGQGQPARTLFDDCHAVVTNTSNVAVEAILAGVPVFCCAANAAYPVSYGLARLDQIERPWIPPRLSWLNSLSYGQFTLEEIRNGYAKEVILHG